MPLARLLGLPDPPRGAALQAGPLPHRPEPPRPPRRGDHQRRRLRRRLVRRRYRNPCRLPSIEPAWNDRNLREVASHVESPLFLAHIRASTGTAVQQTNCHPFRHGKWLWVHNGLVRDFHRIKRELALAVDESLYTSIEGSTDSEMLFYLALTFGLEEDPPGAVERMVGFVEEVGRRHGTEHPIQMTIGTADGNSVWAFRYSSEGKSRTLYYSTDVRTLREMYPDRPRLQELSDESRIMVSEPLVRTPRSLERGARIELRRRT